MTKRSNGARAAIGAMVLMVVGAPWIAGAEAIRTHPAAIKAGREACNATSFHDESDWRAQVHNKVWHVWRQDGICRDDETYWDAATGKQIGHCSSQCVVVD